VETFRAINGSVFQADRDRALRLAAAAAASAMVGWALVQTRGGASVVLFALGVILISAITRWPIVSLGLVIVVAGVFGRTGAHWFVPGIGLPVLEAVVAAGSVAAALHLAERGMAPGSMGPVLIWVPGAVWAILLVAFSNHGDFVSGLRDALMFIYPLLVALPLAALGGSRLRENTNAWVPSLVVVAFVVAGIGIYNTLTGHTSITSSGQARALAGSFAAPLTGGFLAALWIFQMRDRSMSTALFLSLPTGALLLVNHRSAYLAFLFSLIVLGCLRIFAPRHLPRRLAGLFSVLAACIAVVLFVTPVGRAGVKRFEAIGRPQDQNISFRVESTEKALKQEGIAQIVGSGVGSVSTDLRADTTQTSQRGVHNSFAASYEVGGVIGLSALLVPILWCCIQMLKRRSDPLIQLLLTLAVFTMVMAAFNVVLENLYFSVWMWAPLIAGAMIACAPRTGIEAVHTRPRGAAARSLRRSSLIDQAKAV